MPATIWPIVPASNDGCGAVSRGKLAPVPLCQQIPHDLTQHRTRATAIGCQLLTAWAMARPNTVVTICATCFSIKQIPGFNRRNSTPYMNDSQNERRLSNPHHHLPPHTHARTRVLGTDSIGHAGACCYPAYLFGIYSGWMVAAKLNNNNNSAALIGERSIPTERPFLTWTLNSMAVFSTDP
jgi:hypothetical protein